MRKNTRYTYEIFLQSATIGSAEWQKFLSKVTKFVGAFEKWQIWLVREQNVLHYYLQTAWPLPVSLTAEFLLKPVDYQFPVEAKNIASGIYYNKTTDNFASIAQELAKYQSTLEFAKLNFYGLKKFWLGETQIYERRNHQLECKQLFHFAPANFLAIDFNESKTLLYKKFPKFLKLEKVTKLLQASSEQALLQIDPFPYLSQTRYLRHDRYDFAKHSLIIGGSGSGKSRFLASLIDKIYQTDPENYKVVVIDPHDALYKDCASIKSQAVVNFQDLASSIDLFSCRAHDVNAGVELMLTLFQALINDSYNGRLERVLRYATYLLLTAKQFSFLTLRKLLLDLEYRNEILKQYQHTLPVSVTHFFLTDFNELKTQNYGEAIAPIVAFIDEMQMVPVFNSEAKLTDLTAKVQTNFLNIFSLNRLKLGNKVTQTIAGLLMQQLFLLAEQNLQQHLIIIVDEVAVVENPIIARFLSELRKYNTSVILAGQYFEQISENLRAAIFANVSNYYLFRVSRSDAELLTKNLKIKIEGSDNPDDQISLLTGLKLRECLVQISAQDELLPIFKARTMDFTPEPLAENENLLDQDFTFTPANPSSEIPHNTLLDEDFDFSKLPPAPVENQFNFEIDAKIKVDDFTKEYSTSRKPKED